MKRFFFLSFFLLSLVGASMANNNRNLVTQTTSSDCGPAALATLLTFYLDIPATEDEMVRLSNSKLEVGTSLLGLEAAATAKGAAADSFRMTYATLEKQMTTYPGPVIVRVLLPEPHFLVLLHLDKDYAYVGDPAIGNIVLRKKEFLKRWLVPGMTEGYVFLAAGNKPLNETNRQRVVGELAQGLRNMQTTRPPLTLFR